MQSDWAGLPGLLLTLPLSILVATAYFLAAYVREVLGYNIHFTEYHVEYGFLFCAFLNAFVLYPFYLLWRHRKQQKQCELPPPPTAYAKPD